MTAAADELQLELPGLTMAGLAWGAPDASAVVCLHGWLDNAASFAPLAARLPDHRLIALELAGHGHSGHRAAGTPYHVLDWVLDVIRALDRLGLERCALMGHSMGASIAALVAGSVPERVERLVLLEGMGPRPARAQDPRQSLLAHHEGELRLSRVEARSRPASMATAIRARRVASRLELPSAQLLAARGTRRVGEGVLWRNDRRLSHVQPIELAEDHVQDFLRAIACPVLVVDASRGMTPRAEVVAARSACLSDLTRLRVEGGHHVHMDAPGAVAPHVARFLAARGG